MTDGTVRGHRHVALQAADSLDGDARRAVRNALSGRAGLKTKEQRANIAQAIEVLTANKKGNKPVKQAIKALRSADEVVAQRKADKKAAKAEVQVA